VLLELAISFHCEWRKPYLETGLREREREREEEEEEEDFVSSLNLLAVAFIW
jgi:hypothetical protein